MGIYLNPKNKGFQEAINSEIYVDKTGLIACTNKLINTEQKFICVSRPRRFGKSMALKMLAAYYSRGYDSADLFAGYKIEKEKTFQEHLNKYDVIFLNMQQFLIRAKREKDKELTECLEQVVIEDIRKVYGEMFSEGETILAAVLEQIYDNTDKQFIFLIDEWDCVMRERQESEELQKEYLDFLRYLLKDQPYVALAYMTGILPVKKYGQHSALNMFWEYSMTNQKALEEYTGFTEEEVKGLCKRYDMDFAEAGNWYDGYMFTRFQHVYNPKSVVEAMLCHRYSSYWTYTETYDALKVYMDMDYDGLRSDIVQMLGGGHVKVNTRSFQNDMQNFESKDDVLTLLVHLGYLGYDAVEKEVFIPNKEIIEEYETAMSVSGWSEVMRVLKASEKLLEDTLQGDGESVAKALDKAHTEASSILTYNDENSLGCAIGLAYYSARKDYKLIRELPTGRGFADVVFLPLPHTKKPALVVELKYNKTADTAIQQIKDRNYTQALEGYSGEILLVGINYDKDNAVKPHSCIIEKQEINIDKIHTTEIYAKRLHESVCNFKKWAQINHPKWSEEDDNGEWEIGSYEFEEMCNSILKIIEDTSYSKATSQMIDDILFGIARDNECSRIVNALLDYPEWYSVLCKQCLKTNYINAKWQFAESLKDYTGNDSLQEIIFKFLDTGDEYTERLALMSLAYIYPDKSEKYAIDFWGRNKFENDEYQKIMVLHVLYKIQSSQLEHYLDLAEHSKYKWLRENAKEIKRKL